MEDMMFGLFLFVLIYGFLCWLFFEPTQNHNLVGDDAWDMNEKGEIVVRHHDGSTSFTVTPIEQQLKDVFFDSIDEVTGMVTEVTETPTVEELLDGVEVNRITLRKARKIASRLGIRQKVNKKDQPKAWLLAQIKKRLEEKPQETARAIVAVCKAA